MTDLLDQVREEQSEYRTTLEGLVQRRAEILAYLDVLDQVEELLMGLVIYIPASQPVVSASGTLLAEVISQDSIVAGGKTIILRLVGTEWVVATFNAQRQNIIDGIDSDGAEANGWDAERSNIAVTAVVRTSDTEVTITLPALANYVITAQESLTITVPSSALTVGGPLVAPQPAILTQLFILVASGTITTTANGQVIEKKLITADSADNGVNLLHDNVTLRHCQIKHNQSGLAGIKAPAASAITGLLIEDVDVIRTGAPSSGTLPSTDMNMLIEEAVSPVINRVRTQDGSSGILFNAGSNATVDKHESIDQRGPFPRGQGLQAINIAGGSYTNFNIVSDRTVGWPEDNININGCSGTWTISDGVIDGNNARSGVGCMVEGGSASVTFTDIDVIRMGNGAFGHGSAGSSLTYTRCNARENSNLNWIGHGFPASSTPGGIPEPDRAPITFSSLTSGNNTNFVDCEYFAERGADGADAPYSFNLAFDQNFMGTKDWALNDFTMQTGYVFVPTWIV